MNQDSEVSTEFDAQLSQWSQGDCVTGGQWFIHGFNASLRSTDASKNILEKEAGRWVEDDVEGLVIVSQTCDLVRSVLDRPYFDVSPLVAVDATLLGEVRRGGRLQFAEVPGVSDLHLVADLDRTMTLEKPVLLLWNRIRGCHSDRDRRNFADALARKRSRAAFPDKFCEYVKPFQKQCTKKNHANSAVGRTLKALNEIRVQPSKPWQADEINKIKFWFLMNTERTLEEAAEIEHEVRNLMERLPHSDSFESDYAVSYYSEMSAADYLASDRLSLDHLSIAQK